MRIPRKYRATGRLVRVRLNSLHPRPIPANVLQDEHPDFEAISRHNRLMRHHVIAPPCSSVDSHPRKHMEALASLLGLALLHL